MHDEMVEVFSFAIYDGLNDTSTLSKYKASLATIKGFQGYPVGSARRVRVSELDELDRYLSPPPNNRSYRDALIYVLPTYDAAANHWLCEVHVVRGGAWAHVKTEVVAQTEHDVIESGYLAAEAAFIRNELVWVAQRVLKP